MTRHDDDAEETNPLLAAGWRQGVMFDAPGASYEWNTLGRERELGIELVRAIRARERLVLISHDCDIKASDERYVEALICREHKPNEDILGRWDRNSSRYFVVDPVAAYVADASHRVKLAKDALRAFQHSGLAMDELRLYRFVEWLARRYDRPIVPDPIYEQFHRPAYAALRDIPNEQPDTYRQFNLETHGIRVALPAETRPPYTIGMVYLTVSALSSEQLAAIEEVHQAIVAVVSSDQMRVREPPAIIEMDELPFGVLRRTQPFIVDYPSWEDQDAAPPDWLRERQIEREQ